MNILTEKIKGKHFIISPNIKKFDLGNKTFVKQLITENGGTVSNHFKPEEDNYLLLSNRLDHSIYNSEAVPVMLESELVEQPTLDLEYFPNLREKFYAMMHKLGQQKNVVFQHIKIGKPITAKQFTTFEKKLKRPLPKALKEFYSVFGSLQILWYHRQPYQSYSIKAGRNHWNYSYRDNHQGSIQFLPLSTIMKYNWQSEEMCFSMTDTMKMLDYFSEYYMVAVDLLDADNPSVLLGNDHGVAFNDDESMSLTDYVNMTFNMFGLKERAECFVSHFRQNVAAQRANLAARIQTPIDYDFENKAAIEEVLTENKTKFERAIKAKDYDAAEDAVYKIIDIENITARYLLIELYAAKNDEKSFLNAVKWAVKRYNFDFERYEKQTSTKRFQDNEEYLGYKNDG